MALQKGCRNYTESELAIIRQHFDPLNATSSAEMIVEKYIKNRTVTAIVGKASKMGLQRSVRLRKWTKEEELILESNLEESLGEIFRLLQSHWKKYNLPPMGYPAVRLRARLMGKGTKCEKDGYVTREYLAEGLNCSLQMITTWTKVYKSVLNPQTPQDGVPTLFYSLSSFRKFIKEYPGEIARCRPNILWLLTILFP